MVGVWVCGELERPCRVCGAQGGGRPCSSAMGEQRWRVQPLSCLTGYSVVARSTECERGAGGGAHGVREMVGVWVCGELERACRVCGAQGGGRPCSSAVGEQRWRVQPLSCLTSYSVVARSTECERGAGGRAHAVREMVVCGCVCGELERACRVCGAQGGGRL